MLRTYKGPVKPERLARLYRELRSVVRVQQALTAHGLKVSRSTVHTWLRDAGIKLRPKGNDGKQDRVRKERGPKVKVLRKSARIIPRVECPEQRHWRGVVVICASVGDGVCHECTRGYDHGLRDVVTRTEEGSIDSHNGRRKGVPPVG